MTATDELRRMLDERGVEWEDDSESIYWDGIDGTSWTAERRRVGDLRLYSIGCTPEQAIEATLGRRTTTRHGKFRTKYGRSVPCCECCGYGIGDERWHYCPSCGAEVVDE